MKIVTVHGLIRKCDTAWISLEHEYRTPYVHYLDNGALKIGDATTERTYAAGVWKWVVETKA
jgi:hypothetical protein